MGEKINIDRLTDKKINIDRSRVGHRVLFRSVRSVLFCSFFEFWRLMRPKSTQRSFRSFIKNGKECKYRSVLLKRMDAQPLYRSSDKKKNIDRSSDKKINIDRSIDKKINIDRFADERYL